MAVIHIAFLVLIAPTHAIRVDDQALAAALSAEDDSVRAPKSEDERVNCPKWEGMSLFQYQPTPVPNPGDGWWHWNIPDAKYAPAKVRSLMKIVAQGTRNEWNTCCSEKGIERALKDKRNAKLREVKPKVDELKRELAVFLKEAQEEIAERLPGDVVTPLQSALPKAQELLAISDEYWAISSEPVWPPTGVDSIGKPKKTGQLVKAADLESYVSRRELEASASQQWQDAKFIFVKSCAMAGGSRRKTEITASVIDMNGASSQWSGSEKSSKLGTLDMKNDATGEKEVWELMDWLSHKTIRIGKTKWDEVKDSNENLKAKLKFFHEAA